MLFSSFSFILIFLPILLIAYQVCMVYLKGRFYPSVFLFVASSVFVAIGDTLSLLLLILSLSFNYLVLRKLSSAHTPKLKNALLTIGVIFNLSFIGVFKYADFFMSSFGYAFSIEVSTLALTLPLAISFYTFQLIALQVDVWRGYSTCPPLTNVAMFISFFPQLIAGPIVRYEEVHSDIENLQPITLQNLATGSSFFFLGLFKKAGIADTIAPLADRFFMQVENGASPDFIEAWVGSLLYTFQIYFDFSGYSDMAIGLALIFGVRLPENFNSPYKATSIIEFWRHWHMTLSRFLRDYLYIPLGGNRFGLLLKSRNVFMTMLLGGLWHGPSWNFVLWGGVHGGLIGINHLWRKQGLNMHFLLGWFLTFVAVTFAWVVFRTTDFDAALRIYFGMLGFNGLTLPMSLEPILQNISIAGEYLSFRSSALIKLTDLSIILLSGLIAFVAPSSQQFLRGQENGVFSTFQVGVCAIGGAIAFMGLFQVVDFIYFRF